MSDHEDDERDEIICGETIDHDLRYLDVDEDVEQWTCRRCGAEGWNDYSGDKS